MGKTSDLTDRQLIAAIEAGDEEAFEILYYRYRDWVYRLAWRCTGNQADALDVMQETFAYLLRKFPGFSLSAAMTTFLYPVVRNLSIGLRRKRDRAEEDESSLLELPAPACALAVPELPAAVAHLPDVQREVLLMRFVDDIPLADIAKALLIPLGTVKSRLHHALSALREDPRMKQYFED